jgi:hypothetical protein
MDTRADGENFYFTLAESAGGPEGPNIREFRAPADATSFDTIQEQSQVDGEMRAGTTGSTCIGGALKPL